MTFEAISKGRNRFNKHFPFYNLSLPVKNGGHFENSSFLSKFYHFFLNLKQIIYQGKIKITATLKIKFY